jgi:hypothetical protein
VVLVARGDRLVVVRERDEPTTIPAITIAAKRP